MTRDDIIEACLSATYDLNIFDSVDAARAADMTVHWPNTKGPSIFTLNRQPFS